MRSLHFIKTVGAGSFGTVYLAEFRSGQGFRRNVAVKVILANRPDNEMFISRIRDEARLLGLLQDDAILKVLDMVRIEGKDAVVMEYVEGVDLDSVLEDGSPPPPRALCELGAAVAGALSKAHTAIHPRDQSPLNVIHRDVKPANIMITRGGGVKLLDFGVARAKFESRESYTGQLMLGTLNYMAPEYITTAEVSPAADIYGLGLSLWEVASGRSFGQPKVRQTAHEERLSQRLEEIRGGHPHLVTVVEQMTRWDPRARPNAREVEQLLTQAADQTMGKSLRSWSSQVVPRILAARKGAPDNAGLLGKTVEIGDRSKVDLQGGDSSLTSKLEGGLSETLSHDQDIVTSRPDGPTPQRPTSQRPTTPNNHALRDVIIVILKGLLIGGFMGFLAIAALVTFFLVR
ncbi:MAG: serine/threonine-protein kinase [Myxococcota bacterium]